MASSCLACGLRLFQCHEALADEYLDMGLEEEALEELQAALEVAPDDVDLLLKTANLYHQLHRNDEVLPLCQAVREVEPFNGENLALLTRCASHVCYWDGRGELLRDLAHATQLQIAANEVPSVGPLDVCSYPFPAELALQVSRANAMGYMRDASAVEQDSLQPLAGRESLGQGKRMRVAYVSSDYNSEPIAQLMNSVFCLHDSSSFEIFVYALQPAKGYGLRKRIEAGAEHFIDVSGWSSQEIAERIRQDAIHVAVDLNGYTSATRHDLFAARFAPIQVACLGFPGTTGAPYIDYIVVDPVLAPPEVAHCYSEALLIMPHTFCVTDHRQANSEVPYLPRPTRREIGLPEDVMIFACSNNHFKIDPGTFALWCRILARVPGSVLWLLRGHKSNAERRMKAAAQGHGISPDRIIFTDRTYKEDYILRASVADLFLDTPVFNAVTVATDVLWGGCPILTRPLDRFASRAAASLCYATGFGPEMVASSEQEYEEMAVSYGTNRPKLRQLRVRLQQALPNCPLYDTHSWVRDFELGLRRAWAQHQRGMAPVTFSVEKLPPVPAQSRKAPLPVFMDEADPE